MVFPLIDAAQYGTSDTQELTSLVDSTRFVFKVDEPSLFVVNISNSTIFS